MMLAGAATFFIPHSGRLPPKPKPSASSTRAAEPMPPQEAPIALVPRVSMTEEYRLPPELAYDDLIQEAAKKYSVDPALVRAVIRTESAFDPMAVSSAGAQGLMQLMPALAAELGVLNSFDPRENIMAGVKYLSWLLHVHNGDLRLALASYNAGPTVVEQYGGIPPFRETQQYVKTITDLLETH